jgi:dienelactone hydrolase
MTRRRRRRSALTAAGVTIGAGLLAGVLLLSGCGESEGVEVRIEPHEGLLDAPLRLEVEGVEAGSSLRLALSAKAADGVRWTGARTVDADRSGSVWIDGGGLIASLRPTGPRAEARDIALVPPDGVLALRLEARQGDRVVGTAEASRLMSGEDVSSRSLTLARDGLAARLWTRPRGSRRPVAVLSLGGSEGGYGNDRVEALLASHGYPVLQLAYFGEQGLPGELSEIPLEYFVRALERLRSRGAERIVVVGISRGAELALILGARFPELVDGVVAYAPSSVVNPAQDGGPAWTFRGLPLPTVPCSEYGSTSPTNGEAVIAVERISGPVMTVAGVSDTVWPAANYSAAIARRLKEHDRPDTTEIVFPDAGHGVVAAIPYLPNEIGDSDLATVRQADALARTATWPQLLALLERVSSGD